MKKVENILWGIVFIIVGIVLAGNALGLTNINIFFDGWWTLFIIVPCFIGLFKESEKIGNIIGLFIGIIFLLSCQGVIDFDMIWKLIFPTILIVIGISFIFKDTIGGKVSKEIKKLNENKKDFSEYCATFSGQNVKFDNEEFKGAELTAVFGTVKCDISKAIINTDTVINAEAIFGGVEITVPENVQVKVKATPVFGGVSNKTINSNKENVHTVYINATSVFGGVEIR